jgi:hypothetical protein
MHSLQLVNNSGAMQHGAKVLSAIDASARQQVESRRSRLKRLKNG